MLTHRGAWACLPQLRQPFSTPTCVKLRVDEPLRAKEDQVMAMKTIRVRVHAGHLEPLDELQLAEGSELSVIVQLPEATAEPRAARSARFKSRHLGIKGPITRKEIYEDVG